MRKMIAVVAGTIVLVAMFVAAGVFLPEDAEAAYCTSCACEQVCKDRHPDYVWCEPNGCRLVESLSFISCYAFCMSDGEPPAI